MTQLEQVSRRVVGTAGVAIALALGGVPATAQAASAHTVCVPFRASGQGQDLGGGHTTGVLSVGRHQIGTTEASFVLGPGTGPVFSFTGPLTFVPDQVPDADLVAQLDGTFDTSSGSFAARSTSLTGSGPLRQVTGSLQVDGNESLTDGRFVETLTGRLCTPVGGRSALERAVG